MEAKRHRLLRPQRLHRIDARHAPGGQIRGQQRGADQNDRHRDVRRRVELADAVQQRPHQARERGSAAQAKRDPDADQQQNLSEQHAFECGVLRAERQPNPDLVRALRERVADTP